jgi:hypothetical protein
MMDTKANVFLNIVLFFTNYLWLHFIIKKNSRGDGFRKHLPIFTNTIKCPIIFEMQPANHHRLVFFKQ